MDWYILLLPPIGLLTGLLINYLADVLPSERRLTRPVCTNCQAPYPSVDYLLFKACPACGHKRGVRPWLVCILMIAAMLYFHFVPPIFFQGPNKPWTGMHQMEYWASIAWLFYLGMVFVIDLEHRLILHVTSLFGAILGLGTGIYIQGTWHTLVGGATGFAFMMVIYLLGKGIARLRANRMAAAGLTADDEEAFGFGDVLLGWILGMVYGWPLTLGGLTMGVLFAGVVSLIIIASLLVRGRYRDQAMMVFIPYGPCLIASAIWLLYFPNWTMM